MRAEAEGDTRQVIAFLSRAAGGACHALWADEGSRLPVCPDARGREARPLAGQGKSWLSERRWHHEEVAMGGSGRRRCPQRLQSLSPAHHPRRRSRSGEARDGYHTRACRKRGPSCSNALDRPVAVHIPQQDRRFVRWEGRVASAFNVHSAGSASCWLEPGGPNVLLCPGRAVFVRQSVSGSAARRPVPPTVTKTTVSAAMRSPSSLVCGEQEVGHQACPCSTGHAVGKRLEGCGSRMLAAEEGRGRVSIPY